MLLDLATDDLFDHIGWLAIGFGFFCKFGFDALLLFGWDIVGRDVLR